MKNKKILFSIISVIAPAVIIICFVGAVKGAGERYANAEKENLEKALHRAAAACYASEGAYPPNLSYLCEHYGVQINTDKYNVFYDAFAENLMPDITVTERK